MDSRNRKFAYEPKPASTLGIEVQDNPFHKDPMIIRKEEDSGIFVACLKSSGTNIFIDTWTPSERDLSEYQQIVLTYSEPWNPYIVLFQVYRNSKLRN